MFYPVEMKRVAIGVHNSYVTQTIQDLHEAGVFEIIPVSDEKSNIGDILAHAGRSPLVDTISEYILRLDRIFELFDEIPRPAKNIIRDFLSPPLIQPRNVVRRPVQEVFDDIDEVLEELDQIPRIKADLASQSETLTRLEKEIESIELLMSFGFDLAYLGDSDFLSVIAGKVDTEKIPDFLQDIENSGIDELFVSHATSEGLSTVVVALPRSQREEIAEYVRAPRFQVIELTYSGPPAEVLEKLKGQYSRSKDTIKELILELATIEREWNMRLRSLYEELKIEKEEMELAPSCGKSRDVFFIEGFARTDDIDRVEHTLHDCAEGHVFVHENKTEPASEDVPVDYNNPAWLAPFEILTTTFARPLYTEIDPTPFVAPIFVLFFGLMMGDAAYGIIITLCGLFLYKKIGRADPGMRDLCYILTFCGISATILGIIQGGWFGDFLPRYFNINPPFVLLEPLKDPIAFFQLSLIIGIIHINIGLFLALYQNLKARAYRVLVFEQLVWFLLQPCAGVMLAEFFGWAALPSALVTSAEAGILISLVMIFYYLGPMGFFSLTGFLGDWLSYVRIMALSLATGGIAMTINILSQLIAGIHPFMVVVAALVFVGGQIFNLVIQALGGVIHSIRLQYIEFFSKFYTGGGRKFAPFHAKREYTTLKGGSW